MNNYNRFLFLVLFFCLITNLSFASTPRQKCDKLIEVGFEAMDNGNYPKALEYLTRAQLMAEKQNMYSQIFETKNNIGIIYYTLGEYGEALNYYLDCYTIAIKHLNAKKEMSVLNNIAVLYSVENNFVKGEEYFKRAYDIAKRENDHLKIGHYAINLARVANKTGKLELGRKYVHEALRYLKKENKLLLQTKITLAENLLLSGNTKLAKQILFELYPITQKEIIKENNRELLSQLSHAYFIEKKQDSAIYYLNVALKDNNDLESKGQLFAKLSEIYADENDYRQALIMTDSMIISKDSLAKVKNVKLLENNKVKFEILNYKNELNSKEQRLSNERKIFFTAIGTILILLFFVYRLYRNRAVKQEQQKLIAKREQEITSLELENEKSVHLLLEKQLKENETEALLELEKLKNEIEQKNRKLSARALYLSGRNEMIEVIVNSLSGLPEISKNNILKTQIKTLKEHLKTDSEWDNFITHFEEVNQGLLHALKEKHPDLTSNDIRFICYVYMNLSSKEICSIFNITQEACRKRKERISKKMNLDENVSLYEYLSKLT